MKLDVSRRAGPDGDFIRFGASIAGRPHGFEIASSSFVNAKNREQVCKLVTVSFRNTVAAAAIGLDQDEYRRVGLRRDLWEPFEAALAQVEPVEDPAPVVASLLDS